MRTRVNYSRQVGLGLLCIGILFLANRIGQIESRYHARLTIQHNGHELWQSLNNYHRSLLENIPKLPFSACDTQTLSNLQTIVVNHPDISVAFLQNRHTLCSNVQGLTLPLLPETKHSDVTLSPLGLTDRFKTPMLLLSHWQGQQRAGVIIPTAIWRQLLLNQISKGTTSAIIGRTHPKHPQVLVSTPGFKLNLTKPLMTGTHFNKIDHQLYRRMPLPQIDHLYVVMIYKVPQHWRYLAWLIGVLLCATSVGWYRRRYTSLAGLIHYGIDHQQFIAHYQPIISLVNHRPVGVECLLRWQDSPGSLIFPDAFLDSARQAGLTTAITRQLIAGAFDDLAPLLRQHPDFHIGINLYPEHFIDDRLLVLLLEHCQRCDIQPQQLMLELTEQARFEVDQITNAQSVMKKMRQQGIKIAIDDFGTGNASIDYMRQFPFTHLKIDKLYTQAIGSGAITAQMTDSIIRLAKDCRLAIIAEGIETDEQQQYLASLAVDMGQGWLYSKALAVDDLKRFLTSEQHKL